MRVRYTCPSLDDLISDLEKIKAWLQTASLKEGSSGLPIKKYHDIARRLKYTIEALRRLEKLEAALLAIAENAALPPDSPERPPRLFYSSSVTETMYWRPLCSTGMTQPAAFMVARCRTSSRASS